MKAISFVMFFITFNISCGIVNTLAALGVIPLGLTGEGVIDPSNVANTFNIFQFNLSVESLVTTLGLTGLTALMGLLFKQGIFAIYAVLVFVLGLFFKVGQFILFGVQSLSETMLEGTGLETVLPPIFQALTLVFFFFFLASILAQRGDMT